MGGLQGEIYKPTVIMRGFFKRFYLSIHERHTGREAETQAEGEAGSLQGTL